MFNRGMSRTRLRSYILIELLMQIFKPKYILAALLIVLAAALEMLDRGSTAVIFFITALVLLAFMQK
jgi:hypothetical protein